MTRLLNLFRKKKLLKKLHTQDGHLARIHIEKTPHLMTTRLYHITIYSKDMFKEVIYRHSVTGDLLAIALVQRWTADKIKR